MDVFFVEGPWVTSETIFSLPLYQELHFGLEFLQVSKSLDFYLLILGKSDLG